MKLSDFDFEVPAELIAAHPAEPRDSARLLHVAADRLADLGVGDLPRLMAPGDVMVFNDTKVIPARLGGRRGTAGVSVTLHHRDGPGRWRAFAKPARKLSAGDRIDFAGGFSADVVDRAGGEVTLDFGCDDATLATLLHAHGEMPLPPYIPRPEGAEARDAADYQTVFAAREGAVAAPTAGLHFTERLLAAIRAAGIETAAVTLHVGAGTFLPVKVEDPRDHPMHAEWGEIGPEAVAAIRRCRARGGRVTAIGTTALRLLESAARTGTLAPFSGDTSLFILPGFEFRVVDRLMTNFHLPRSTLFMLVAAFAGRERMKRAYAHAVEAGYRFYSYGDATLLDRAPDTDPPA